MNETNFVILRKDNKITVPKALRDQLGWTTGTRLALQPRADGSILIEEVEPPTDPVSKGRRKPAR